MFFSWNILNVKLVFWEMFESFLVFLVKLNWFECSLSSFPWTARASFAGLPQVQLWIRLGDKCDHHQGSQIVLILTPVTAFPIRRWRNPLMDRSSTTSTWPAISEPFEASCKKSTVQGFAWKTYTRVWWHEFAWDIMEPWFHLLVQMDHQGHTWAI